MTKFSKRVENAVGKGEIACYEQCFQKTFTADRQKPRFVWQRDTKICGQIFDH